MHAKKKQSMAHSLEKKEIKRTVHKEAQTLELGDKTLKSTVLNTLKVMIRKSWTTK